MSSGYIDIPTGGGVRSLNGLTGALTLIAGTGITITPGAGTLTIDSAGGSPGGADGSVQFNDSGAFGGFGDWDGTLLGVTNIEVRNNLTVDGLIIDDSGGTIGSIDTNARELLDDVGNVVVSWSNLVSINTMAAGLDITIQSGTNTNITADQLIIIANTFKVNDEIAGLATLVGGTVTVPNANVTANSIILLTAQVPSGVPGFLSITATTPGTDFTITSSSVADTSIVGWMMVEWFTPAP